MGVVLELGDANSTCLGSCADSKAFLACLQTTLLLNFWFKVPLARIAIPVLVGVLVGGSASQHSFLPLVTTGILVLIYAFQRIGKKSKQGFPAISRGILVTTMLFLGTIQYTLESRTMFSPQFVDNFIDKGVLWKAEVTDVPQVREKSIKVVLSLSQGGAPDTSYHVIGDVMAYFEPDSASLLLEIGDEVVIASTVRQITPPANPAEFDYRKYLSHHNIHHQTFIKKGEWLQHQRSRSFNLYAWASRLRKYGLNALRQTQMGEEELAVVYALVLGYKSDLDDNTTAAYAAAGAMHVLAVSGLHVGLIFMVFSHALSFLDRTRRGRILRACVLIGIIWCYALVTGLSASVMRASCMFTLVVIGQSISRNSNIFNTIAASALILILFNPLVVFEVSFQLSYLAVIGIIYLQPKIYNWFYFENKLLDKLWALTAVSIAAQLATSPLGFLIFHQFPNYFLIANIFVIPLATLILYFGLGVLVFESVPGIGRILTSMLDWLTSTLNWLVKWITELPFSVTSGVSISTTQAILLYGIVVASLWWLAAKNKSALRWALMALLIFLIIDVFDFRENQVNELVVYQVGRNTAVDFIAGEEHVLVIDSILAADSGKINYHIQPYWIQKGLKNTPAGIISNDTIIKPLLQLEKHGSFISFQGHRILVGSYNNFLPKAASIAIDIAIASRGFYPKNLGGVLPKMIVTDASCSARARTAWLEYCELNDVQYHNTREAGALVMKLQ